MQGYEQAKIAAIPTVCVGRGYEQTKVVAIPTTCVGRGYEQAKIAAIPTLPTATAVRGTHDRKQRTLEPPVLTPCTVGCYVPLRAKGSGSVPAVVMCASRSVPCTNASAAFTQPPFYHNQNKCSMPAHLVIFLSNLKEMDCKSTGTMVN